MIRKLMKPTLASKLSNHDHVHSKARIIGDAVLPHPNIDNPEHKLVTAKFDQIII